ncbi:MAG: hypothetical protein QW314_07135 [Thermoproteota archaeon]
MAYDEGKTTEEFEKEKRIWIKLTVALGISILVAGLLDLLFQGVSLGFTIPLINEPASMSRMIYYVSVIVAGIYIGFIGLRELVFENRFSVEFLMSIAALGAVSIGFLFEGTTVLFLYSSSESGRSQHG